MRFWFRRCRLYANKEGKQWEVGLVGKHWWDCDEKLAENKSLELAMKEAKLIIQTIQKEVR